MVYTRSLLINCKRTPSHPDRSRVFQGLCYCYLFLDWKSRPIRRFRVCKYMCLQLLTVVFENYSRHSKNFLPVIWVWSHFATTNLFFLCWPILSVCFRRCRRSFNSWHSQQLHFSFAQSVSPPSPYSSFYRACTDVKGHVTAEMWIKQPFNEGKAWKLPLWSWLPHFRPFYTRRLNSRRV